ncbi:hypothetical protein Patl1_19972 [Pistacia atlantica]|uniref:Uncharacterized protein n=1 Tax=Pistacia atlantica TaxID=434234 RepID=A0ACC1BHQ3_9ROSI|nr:hypothetical protein Patl1_19972 [Pistacia atlantica]
MTGGFYSKLSTCKVRAQVILGQSNCKPTKQTGPRALAPLSP